MDSSDFKGCGPSFVMLACALIVGGCLKQRTDSATIHALTQLVDEVHTKLKKGQVRQALELLEIHEAGVEQGGMAAEDRAQDGPGSSY